ncbi:MAG: hypothetical protein JNN05_01360, partial [Candidatus Omnitrophica bacterium]|nr:hypothetical protein [Candidatus Omnitrophota bacterium]
MVQKFNTQLGQKLIDAGVITAGQLKTAIDQQAQRPRPLSELLVELGFVED